MQLMARRENYKLSQQVIGIKNLLRKSKISLDEKLDNQQKENLKL